MDGYCMLLSTRFIIREQNDIKVHFCEFGDLVFEHLVRLVQELWPCWKKYVT